MGKEHLTKLNFVHCLKHLLSIPTLECGTLGNWHGKRVENTVTKMLNQWR
ncbi:uncharacterized protein DS421_14g448620 [Arachis hypogaea]|nr:uncharacterized protein DS421_14g448620 [Arachis hypogaea]